MSTQSIKDAREQAAKSLGYVVSEIVTAGDKTFEIPNPSMLDDDQQERVDALDIEVESWDHEPDILNEDGTVKTKGALKEPCRKDGVQVENYRVQLAKAILGDDYAAFKAAGGRGSDVNLIWTRMNRDLAKRVEQDSKSADGDSAVAAVPEADSD